MNSIAFMPKPPPPSSETAESLALKAALRDAKLSQAAVAEKLDVHASMVSQWANGTRPVPADKARKLAKVLGVEDPRLLSAAYASVAEHEPGAVVPLRVGEPAAPLRQDLVNARLQNDVDALRYVASALVATMVIHRPAEASEVAKAVRRTVPAKFRDQGFVHELLEVLDRAGRA